MDASPVAFLVALGIGALIGLEREHAGARLFAASRTLPLISLLGVTVQTFYPALLPWAFGAIAILSIAGYLAKVRVTGRVGATTSTAALLTFIFGALAAHSPEARLYAVVMGAGTAALLAAKEPLHTFASHITRDERFAMAKFLVVALVVFPMLPDRDIDLLWGLNPRFVWLMVVLISAIDLLGFLLARVIGARRGLGLTAVLGGLVSSTATMVGMAHQAVSNPRILRIAAYSALAATVISFPRVLIEVAVVDPGLVRTLAVPIAAMVIVGVLGVAWMWRGSEGQALEHEVRNPFRLGPALWFGVLFAVILLASDFLSGRFGGAGVYATALVSGIADVDAPTLSFAALARDGQISGHIAARGVVFALLSNLAVKTGIAFAIGGPEFGRRVAVVMAGIGAVGLVVVWWV